ncbi:hypothetical protein KR032_003582 [Drosophila birchii]|nr:hypothetical protein KR032_003582 [Drosophila birchii]
MSDRYPASFYDQQHHSHQHLAPHPAMSHYPPQPYRSGYTGYHPYAGYGYGSSMSSATYMPNYYRYAPYASPHYSQHHQGMFTPAGQQLIPSSVLHYPPRSHPYQQQAQQHPAQQPLPHPHPPGYEQPAPSPYSSSASYSSRGFGGYTGPTPHYAPPGRSSTPAPNRTVLPPNYLEPLRSYTEQQQHAIAHQPHLPLAATPKLEDPDIEVEASGAASPAQRLTTSPPMISATGTDSGISNCSTRARSDSSQSTPVYSGEYPVNMSVESASCVPYHCPADGRDFEEEELQPAPVAEAALRTDTPLDIPDDISATSPVAGGTDKLNPTPSSSSAPPEVARRAEINLQPETSATDAPTTPQDAGGDPISESVEVQPGHAAQQQQHPVTANWSPTPRRPRTPPAPQNSPIGFGQTAIVPPALAPLLQQQQQQQQQLQQQQQHQQTSNLKRSATLGRNRNSCSSNNRIMECDLIPSKKSKRKATKKEAGEGENMEPVEPIVREQIRDIKPLPGFLQAFGSTEIGRFSERFLQTPESLVERLAEEYAASSASNFPASHPMGGGYMESSTTTPTHSYYAHEEGPYHGGDGSRNGYPRNRMRGHGFSYEMPDYMAYERYAAYGAGRPRGRYGEIRCNGY